MIDPSARLRTDTSVTPEGVITWSISAGLYRHSLSFRSDYFEAISWKDRSIDLSGGGTHFGYLHAGTISIDCETGRFQLCAGMYFSVPGAGRIEGNGCGQLTSQPNFRGIFQIGGPIEDEGRLPYIDGCSDTLLIPPVVRGNACLNLLYIPPHTTQTAHTHPSFRCGLVTSGEGTCETRSSRLSLTAGTAFAIEADALHSFHTTDKPMRVIAFHPDSDYGPWHDDHPMVNRTIINGRPAARLSPLERHIEREREPHGEMP